MADNSDAVNLAAQSLAQLSVDQARRHLPIDNPDAADQNGQTALHRLVGWTAQALLLLSAGANPNIRDLEGNTPAHLACEDGYIDYLEVLQQHGADLLAVDNAGRGLAHFAAAGDRPDVLRWLMDKGVPMDLKDSLGQEPITVAIQAGSVAVAELLVEKGYLGPAVDVNYMTPLHHAAMNGTLRTLMHLPLFKPSTINAVDKRGRTALHLACISDMADLEDLQWFPYGQTRVDMRDSEGRTPLHLAAMEGVPAHLTHLIYQLHCHRHINEPDNANVYPLTYAVKSGNGLCVEIILDNRHFVPGYTQHNGETPWTIVAAGNLTEVAEVLIRRNYSVGTWDPDPVQIAREAGYEDLAVTLAAYKAAH